MEDLEEASAPTDVDSDTVAEGAGARRKKPREATAREDVPRGTPLGRYLVVEKIARGGMGVVYAAYDPELHRRVAIKLLRPGKLRNDDAGRARMLREAQAMARLSHPNVIHVYDVGTFEDAIFLAIEFVDGENLAKWIKRERRPWREVLRVFLAAGRGLAAAHAAGLVHRDFKPDNVLIGKDGRVLVTDFGLAREAGDDLADADTEAADDDEDELDEPSSSASAPSGRGSHPSIPNTPLSTPLTKVGSVMGTPGYAAPEQVAGVTADARSDQFGFAASLYAGLYRRRPFPGSTFPRYRELLAAGLPEPPPNSGVPTWLRRVVERGLAGDPAARYPSMDAFLDALSRDPSVTHKRLGIAAAAIAVLGGTIVATTAATRSDDDVCTGAGDKVAAAWNTTRRDQVKAAFLATKRPYAQSAFDTVARRLDDRGRAWATMHTETCQATRKRGDQPESVMALRMACLDQRLREQTQLVDVFAAADGPVVERAVGATSALSAIDDCADVTRLLAAVAPPKDAPTRTAVEELQVRIGRAKVLTDAGKYKDALAVATEATTAARKLSYGPILAEGLAQLGEIQSYLGESEASVATLREAVRVADASRDDRVRARAFSWMVGVVGYDLEKAQEGLVLAEDARATIDRLGGDLRFEAHLEANLGRTYSVLSSYEKMLEHHQKALELRRRAYGDEDPWTANSLNNVAAAYNQLGRVGDALDVHRRTLAMREKALGAEHPSVAMSWANIGNQHFTLGDLEEGIRASDQALAIAKKSLPMKNQVVLAALVNRASMLAELGKLEDAIPAFDELLAILRADFAKSGRLSRALSNWTAFVLVPSGRIKEALATADEALALAVKVSPTVKTDDYALALWAKGIALDGAGQADAAVASLNEGITLTVKLLGGDKVQLIDLLSAVARIELARGRIAEAHAAATRTLAILERYSIGGKWLARTRFQLARTLPPADREKAVALATQARVWYAATPLTRDLAEIDAWLAAPR